MGHRGCTEERLVRGAQPRASEVHGSILQGLEMSCLFLSARIWFESMGTKGVDMRPRYLRYTLLAICCLVPAVANAAELRGKVLNRGGQPIERAKVVIEGKIIGQARVTFSKQSGEFSFWGLPPGDYKLTVVYKDLAPNRQTIRITEEENVHEIRLGKE